MTVHEIIDQVQHATYRLCEVRWVTGHSNLQVACFLDGHDLVTMLHPPVTLTDFKCVWHVCSVKPAHQIFDMTRNHPTDPFMNTEYVHVYGTAGYIQRQLVHAITSHSRSKL